MSQSTTVFTQVLQLIPKMFFDTLSARYHLDKHVSALPVRSHFAVLLFAQFAGLKSLREIVQATALLFSSANGEDLISVKRSTLSDANKRIDWRFYRDLFQTLWNHFSTSFDPHNFPVPGDLLTLDSTMIKVCLQRFPWATYRKRKGALKLHTLLDHRGYLPRNIVMTNGRKHDSTIAKTMTFQPGTTLLLDRGYFDSKWFYRLHTNGCFFVTRIKRNIGFEYTQRKKADRKQGIYADWIGHMTDTPGENYPEPLRLVRFIDPDTGKELEFLTNLMDLEATIIADLYKQRWQVELFFKWIKQNLRIKTFLGTSENAVLSQIWIAMIAYLLLKVIEKTLNNRTTAHHIRIFIATHILKNIQLSHVWKDFQRTKTKRWKQQKLKPS